MAQQGSGSRAKKILGVGALLFIVLGCLIMLLCNFRSQYVSQAILNQERDLQQIWLNRAMDAISAWRNELTDQARFISSSEMFRLFISDALEMDKEHFERLQEPDSLHAANENLRSMAEQLSYLRDLLRDLTRRRAWTDARILLPDGQLLVGPEFSLPLLQSQKDITQQAIDTGKVVFGPLRSQDGLLTMDMADPLFQVLGSNDPRPIGALLLSVPMEKALTTFLTNQTEKREGISPRIVSQSGQGSAMALLESGIVVLEAIEQAPPADYPFMERMSLDGQREVYSLGARPAGLNWQYVLETPAALVQARIHDQKVQIYALGGLASLGLALLGAFIWASLTSKQHKLRVQELTRLNRQIDQQKTMLESINSSMTAGLLLADDHDNAIVTNPNFLKIIGRTEDIPPHTPLAEILPPDVAMLLQQKMKETTTAEATQSSEIELGDPEDRRLYRVTFYPYLENDDGKKRCAGCVAIFQDITMFRRKAKIQKEREEAMLSALGRAIESVDPSLVGHSDKMAQLAAQLADKLDMDDDQRAALRISARLSQVGKLFVPHELLVKEGKLTPEELAEVRKAPEYADRILHNLHFDLPIRQIVAEMGQKVDASGNVAGTSAPMSLCGKALGVINAFIAMTSPRAYRQSRPISPREALELLEQSGGFDLACVEALGDIDPAQIDKIIHDDKKS